MIKENSTSLSYVLRKRGMPSILSALMGRALPIH